MRRSNGWGSVHRGKLRGPNRRRPAIEHLEHRRVLAAFLVTNTDDFGSGSLRQALIDANTALNVSVPDRIEFNIPGAGPHTISVNTQLPSITDAVVIDGYTQPGSAPNSSGIGEASNAVHLIQLEPVSSVSDGLFVAGSGGTTIQGLVINGFAGSGIVIESANNVVRGNEIGPISGPSSPAGNGNGILVVGPNAVGNQIGGDGAADRNVISFNSGPGILVASTSGGDPSFNRIQRNSIHNNGGLGIDLSREVSPPDDVTINDPGDSDPGPNGLQNYPVLRRAVSDSDTRVTGFLDSAPNMEFTIEFFENVVFDPTGNGEGQNFLGSITVFTDEFGSAEFGPEDFDNDPLPATSGSTFITATATDPSGNTSEFSSAADVLERATISGFKYNDFNGDGIFDSSEDVGVEGVQINLSGDTNGDGFADVNQTAFTVGSSGIYSFGSLLPGEYTISEVVPTGSLPTTPPSVTFIVNEGGDFQPFDPQSPFFNAGLAFGNFLTFTISGLKFLDSDGDGSQGPNEFGLPNWTIVATRDDGATFSTLTDINGSYQFSDLGPGTYDVREIQQFDFVQTTPDPSPIIGLSGQDVTDVDFGNQFLASASISGFKFNDHIGDGIFDSSEDMGVDGVQINLSGDTNGDEIPDVGLTAFTDGGGFYSFDGLLPGEYTISEVIPSASVPTTSPSVTFMVEVGGEYHPFDPLDSFFIPGLAFGNFRTFSISGLKFEDVDGDGSQGPNEFGLPGWTIVATRSEDGAIFSDVTGFDGTYQIPELGPGTYFVQEIEQPDYEQTTPDPSSFIGLSGADVFDVDFGNRFITRASIAGIKFDDLNRNGVQDSGEGGIPGFRIYWDANNNGEFDPGERSSVTDSDGRYLIEDLDPGRYVIAEVQQPGYIQTAPPGGYLPPIALQPPGGYVVALTHGDFNGDGIADLAATNGLQPSSSGTRNSVVVMLGNGDATFSSSEIEVGLRPVAITTFQQSGLTHLAVLTAGDSSGTFGGEPQIQFLINQGNGSFARLAQTIPAGSGAIDLDFGDVNDDGLVDVVVANFRSGQVSVFVNQGGFDYTATQYDVGSDPVGVSLVDLDGDEYLDLLVANSGSDDVSLLSGLGDGTFELTRTFAADVEPSSVEAGDIDGNGTLDVAITNYLSNSLYIYFDANSSPSLEVVSLPQRPRDLLVSDIDGDGRDEVLVANAEQDAFSVIGVQLNGQLSASSFSAGGGGSAIVSADFNGDGMTDVGVASLNVGGGSNSGSRVTIMLNSNGVHVVDLTAGEMRDDVDFGNYETTITVPIVVPEPEELDVTGDGRVSALDALMVINRITRIANAEGESGGASAMDVNGDGILSASDALRIINYLHRESNQVAVNPEQDSAVDNSLDDLITQLADDIALSWYKA